MVTVLKKSSSEKEVEKELSKAKNPKTFDARKYAGTIKLAQDPIAIQKKLRDEWK